MKKIILLFLLSACSTKDPWEVSYIQTGDSRYNSSKLSYRANSVNVEMICLENNFYTYLYIHNHFIPPVQDNPKIAVLTLESEGEAFSAPIYRHEGGQKVQLFPELQEILLSRLKAGKNVTLRLQGFSVELPAQKFTAHFKELQKSPLRLPFTF